MTPHDIATLATALRAYADGIPPVEAGVGLVIDHGQFLHRTDFTHQFVDTATSITDGTPMAIIDWPGAIAALETGHLPCSGSQKHILQLDLK
jgi:hypothetical protein